MANPNRAEDVVKPAALQTADKIETAVRKNDKAGYDNAMTEVNKFRESHTPAEMKAYTATVTGKLEADKVLPTVSLFEAQNSFDKIALGSERLEKGKLDLYKHRDDVNDVQKAFITNIENRYDNIRMISTWGENFYGGNADDIHRDDINDGVKEQQAQMNLYAPGKDGTSLIDKLKDKDGNIPHGAIANLLQLEEQHPGQYLSPEDKRSLEDINTKRRDNFLWNNVRTYIPYMDDVSKEELTKMATDSQLQPADLEAQKRGARMATPVTPDNLSEREVQMKADAAKEEQRAQDALKREEAKTKPNPGYRSESRDPHPPYDHNSYERYGRSYDRNTNPYDRYERNPNARAEREEKDSIAKIDEALKVRKGESYSHAAERLLALAGNTDASGKDIKEISHQLWIADQRRKANGLRVGQQLQVNDAIKNNRNLAALWGSLED